MGKMKIEFRLRFNLIYLVGSPTTHRPISGIDWLLPDLILDGSWPDLRLAKWERERDLFWY
jgi:hypothetical protein